jgi:Holliday junction resolvasome RuvABC endonuclease subunit
MNHKQTILALDLGIQTGWCIKHTNGNVYSGSVFLGNEVKSRTKNDPKGKKLLTFQQFLYEIHEKYLIDIIYYEHVVNHNTSNSTYVAHAYGGYLAILTAWCEQEQIPYTGVNPGTIKKHLTGNGKAKKEIIIDAVKALGYYPHDHNQADAIAIMEYVKST